MTLSRPATARLGHRIPPLRSIYFYLTEGCNMACRHCWLAPEFTAERARGAVLPVSAFRRVLREARPLGLQSIKLTGGEPLLHPHFLRLIDLAEDGHLRVNIETNGLLCTPAMARRIARLPHAFVSVSLDGARASTHEWVRRVAGSFQRACRTVQWLAEAGLRPQIVMTLLRINAGEVEDMIGLARHLGAESLKFNLLQPTARGRYLYRQGDILTIGELLNLGRRVERLAREMVSPRLFFDWPPAFRPLWRIAHCHDLCGITTILGVLSTGEYSLCGIGTHVKKLVLGRVGVDNVCEVWKRSPVLREIRRGLPRKLAGICGICLMKGLCLGECLAQNFYRTGSFWAPFWFCEEAQELGVFPATRLGKGLPEAGKPKGGRE